MTSRDYCYNVRSKRSLNEVCEVPVSYSSACALHQVYDMLTS